MSKVTLEITTSLDGFVAGPDVSAEQPLGEGGEQLHEWIVRLRSWRESHGLEGGTTGPDDELLRQSLRDVGAVVMGRGMFGGEGPWGDEPWEGWWGDEPPFRVPVFVLTHHPREPLVKIGTTYTFVTDGIESALAQAGAAAGEKNVAIAGGASTAQQYLRAGLVDELLLHVAPMLLGGGRRLFEGIGREHVELEKLDAIDSPAVTHLRFRVARPS